MELRQLKYFLRAKELLNFTAAASELHISQSTLSQQIKQLEIELSTPLFERIGKRIKLTEAGELFHDYALKSVTSANNGFQMLRDLNNMETGELKIGVTFALRQVIATTVKQFLALYPKILVHIVYGTSEELLQKLDNFELDFILSFEEFEKNNSHQYQPLFDSPMVLIGSPESDLKNVKKIRVKDIENLPLALPAKGFSTRKYIDDVFKNKNLNLNISIEVNDIPMLLDLVKTGKYYTILAKTTIQDYDSIIAVPIIQPPLMRKGMIISVKDIYEKRAVSEFYKIIDQYTNSPSPVS
ncbi:LysR family transcriptional regulator [Arenibacter echinorum]|uniref:LysR family cyn operon transcriptional activator n=1 Tax=Arenibacter echinorum TaxID=440515 RepID=A0A327R7H4_9FLAO|nr:LysR family transcriptional regulator [Arenibacter echinorum]RAJ12789.1 LysR family cyn operon transcriptional activator [Arenibacter echinorum]